MLKQPLASLSRMLLSAPGDLSQTNSFRVVAGVFATCVVARNSRSAGSDYSFRNRCYLFLSLGPRLSTSVLGSNDILIQSLANSAFQDRRCCTIFETTK